MSPGWNWGCWKGGLCRARQHVKEEGQLSVPVRRGQEDWGLEWLKQKRVWELEWECMGVHLLS